MAITCTVQRGNDLKEGKGRDCYLLIYLYIYTHNYVSISLYLPIYYIYIFICLEEHYRVATGPKTPTTSHIHIYIPRISKITFLGVFNSGFCGCKMVLLPLVLVGRSFVREDMDSVFGGSGFAGDCFRGLDFKGLSETPGSERYTSMGPFSLFRWIL